MFCPECGTENKDDSKFCKKCGTLLDEVSVSKNDSSKEVQNKQNQIFLNKNTKIIIVTIIIIAIIAVGAICLVSTSSAGQAISFAGKDFYIPQNNKITGNTSSVENGHNYLILEYTHNGNQVSVYGFDSKKTFDDFESLLYGLTATDNVDSELPVTVLKDPSTGSYEMTCEIDGHYFDVQIVDSNDDKALQEFSEFCKLNPNIKDYIYSGNAEPTESDESSVTIEFDDKFETQTSEGSVWQHTGSKDIGDGDTIGIIYIEGYDDQSGENYPFMVQGYTTDNGPGLLHHAITKVVYYYEENGQTFTETRDGEGLINVEPPKKPIKVVVYYN